MNLSLLTTLRPGHFGQGITVTKLILADFDGHIANIILKIYTHIVYINVYVVLNFSLLSIKTFEIRRGGVLTPHPLRFQTPPDVEDWDYGRGYTLTYEL